MPCSVAFTQSQSLKIFCHRQKPIMRAWGKKTSPVGYVVMRLVRRQSITISNQIGIRWENPEIEHDVKGVVAYSPDHETAVSFDGEGYLLNRKVLPKSK